MILELPIADDCSQRLWRRRRPHRGGALEGPMLVGQRTPQSRLARDAHQRRASGVQPHAERVLHRQQHTLPTCGARDSECQFVRANVKADELRLTQISDAACLHPRAPTSHAWRRGRARVHPHDAAVPPTPTHRRRLHKLRTYIRQSTMSSTSFSSASKADDSRSRSNERRT